MCHPICNWLHILISLSIYFNSANLHCYVSESLYLYISLSLSLESASLSPYSYVSILQICSLIPLYLSISISRIYIPTSLFTYFNSANLHYYISVSLYLYLSKACLSIPIHVFLNPAHRAFLDLCISRSNATDSISLKYMNRDLMLQILSH